MIHKNFKYALPFLYFMYETIDSTLQAQDKKEFFEELHRRLRSGEFEPADPIVIENPNLTPERAVAYYGRMLLDNSPQPADYTRFRG